MSTSQGLGRRHPGLLALQPWSAQFGVGPLGQDAGKTLANELYYGGYPPPPVQIPVSWIRAPARLRMDPPFARAEVGQTGGATARSHNPTAAVGGREWVFTETVASIVDVDAANLAQFITTYYDEPLPRGSALTLVLNDRTETEIWRILGVTQGRHIQITETSGWPDGSTDLAVEGITHLVTADLRTVTWATAPIIGVTTGTAGPWFYAGDSTADGTDAAPF